jgi:PKD repeat protein
MNKLGYWIGSILICISCTKDPFADFEISGTLEVGKPIEFINHSKNSDKFDWGFGDGSYSYERSPVQTYHKAGDYTVILYAINENGTSIASKRITITGITYSFLNKTDITLEDFCTFYWNGTDIEDYVFLGEFPYDYETEPVITTKPEIMFSFSFNGTYYINASKYLLIKDKHNLFTINYSTPLYIIEGSKSPDKIKMELFKIQKLNIIINNGP